MDTLHPQVPVLWFTCDEEIADLITLMNYCGIHTVNSCQDNRYNRGTARRIWVEVLGQDLLSFLTMLDRPQEVDDLESISHRMATEFHPDDTQDFREDRAWHYRTDASRKNGELLPIAISIRFPHTDLDDVVARLRAVAREIAGLPPADNSHDTRTPGTEGGS